MTLPNTDPFTDRTCTHLAEYLRDWLNAKHPQELIVKSVRAYDAFNVPYQEYPLLKVYRMSKEGTINRNTKTRSQIAISYILVLPDLEQLTPVLNWVGDQIMDALAAYRIDHEGCSPKIEPSLRIDFRTMLNELTQRVHPFLRVSLSLEEF